MSPQVSPQFAGLGLDIARCGPCSHHPDVHLHSWSREPTNPGSGQCACLLDAALVMRAHSHAPGRWIERCQTGCCWQQRASLLHSDLVAARSEIAAFLADRGSALWVADSADFPLRSPVEGLPPTVVIEGHQRVDWRQGRVAIIGTRSASPHGIIDATELGASMAEAGLLVLSGLALGIDAAAHRGAISAGGVPVGIVGTGLDQVYPRRHVDLHRKVRDSGALLSQFWYGVGPRAYHFPIRNRLIAALADVVVVVEATLTGGTHSTVEHALAAGRPVFAIPGSRRNPAAEGCNRLIADGAIPLLEADDVLTQLGMVVPSAGVSPRHDVPEPLSLDDVELMSALSGEPVTVEQLAERLAVDFQTAAERAARAVEAGFVFKERGFLWPR